MAAAPDNNLNIVGHQTQRNALYRLLSSRKLPHALLFVGMSGIGKSLVARDLAQSLLCLRNFPRDSAAAAPGLEETVNPTPGGCGSCLSCRHAACKSHADLHLIDCSDRTQNSTSDLRTLLYSLNLAPFEAANRAVILDNVEALIAQAANALLKSLEEPRSGTYFILITSSPSKLLRTIVSRCHTVFFNCLNVDEISQIVNTKRDETSVAHAAWSTLSAEAALLADGSLENLERLSGCVELWAELSRELLGIASGDYAAAIRVSRQLSGKRDDLRDALRIIRVCARLNLKQRAGTQDGATWAYLLTNVITAERLIFERNLSALNVLCALLTMLAHGAQRQAFTASRISDTLLENIVS